MAEARYATTATVPREVIWDFVSDMNHFAAFFPGYQEHHQESDTESVWCLKGDLGAMTRMLKFRVKITEWTGPERVRFELVGINEQLSGAGSFELEPFEQAEATDLLPAEPRKGLVARTLEAIFRFFFQRVRGTAERADSADAGPAVGTTRILFQLKVDPGGPMAPMINAMIKPLMPSFAEDFAGKLVGHLEAEHGQRPHA